MSGLMLDVRVEFDEADFNETLRAHAIGRSSDPGGLLVEIKSHATFSPLAPGDQVRIDHTGRIIHVVALKRLNVFRVFCHLPAGTTYGRTPTSAHPAIIALDRFYEELKREALVTRTTAFTYLITPPSECWFQKRIARSPYVEWTEQVRCDWTRFDTRKILTDPLM